MKIKSINHFVLTAHTLLKLVIPLFIFLYSLQVDSHLEHTISHPIDDKDNCIILLKQLASLNAQTGLTEEFAYQIETATVKAIGTIDGIHGGKLIRLKRIEPIWSSNRRTVGYDPQGDPRWFIEVLGSDVASFLGFKIIDNENMLVPDFKEFTGALKIINAELAKKNLPELSISFYPTKTNENVSVSLYVNLFIKYKSIPMAPSGNHLLHDLSFHTGAIFLPDEIINYKIKKILYEKDFFIYLHQQYPNNEKAKKAINYFQYLNNFKNTIDIDTVTGDVNTVLVGINQNSSDISTAVENFMGRLVANFIDGDRTPHKSLLRFFDLAKNANRVFSYMDPRKINNFFSNIPMEELTNHLINFSGGYSGSSTEFKPNVVYGEFHDVQGFVCKFINQQRTHVRMIVKGLTNSQQDITVDQLPPCLY